jgi:maleamate amidohydrolase
VTADEQQFADGFAGTLTPGPRPALLVVDLMRAYFDQASPLCLPSDRGLAEAATVLAAARRAAVPVVHSVVRYGEGGLDGGIFLQKLPALRQLIGDSPMGQPMPAVAPLPHEAVVIKQYASAFFGTSLASMLQAQRVDTVVIVGTSTSGCVRATAVDALQHGFVPLVVQDASLDRDESVHRATLYDLQAKYAEVVTLQEVLDYLSTLGHPTSG